MRNNEKVKRVAGVTAVMLILLLLSLMTVYSINEQQQGVITTFGKATKTVGSGLHFKIPFIQTVKKVDTTIHGLRIGYDENGEFLESESLMITSDYNFVNVDFYVEAKVSDPVTFLYCSTDPYEILKNIAQGCIRSTVGTYDVDGVITTSKNEIQSKIKEMIIAKLESVDIGLSLVNITIQDSEPPTAEVIQAFKEVENAKQSMDTVVNNAEKYRSEETLKAEAEADKITQAAEGMKESRIQEANGQNARFMQMFKEYKNDPQTIRLRMFYETMQDVLPDMKVIINGADQTSTILALDGLTGGKGTQAAEAGAKDTAKEDTDDGK